MARNTRQRILEACLRLFNENGEPNVTTNQVADELDISPGNLHYHYRSKARIVDALFQEYQHRLAPVLRAPAEGPAHLEDAWFLIHLLFEAIWDYRFIYRDLDSLVSRYPELRNPLKRLILGKEQMVAAICRALGEGGQLEAEEEEIPVLARNMNLVLCYWLSYQNALDSQAAAADQLARGVYQIFALLLPYLQDDARVHLHALARGYLA